MSRPKLIKQLKKKHPKLSHKQLNTIIDNFFESIELAHREKKSVELRDLGTFFTKEIKSKLKDRKFIINKLNGGKLKEVIAPRNNK